MPSRAPLAGREPEQGRPAASANSAGHMWCAIAGLDFLFALQPGSGAQEKGTVFAQADGTIVRDIAVTTSDADLDRFRQTFRVISAEKVVTSMMEQTAKGWTLDPPGEIVMEKASPSVEPTPTGR